MNIFENYLEKIINLLNNPKLNSSIQLPEKIAGINVDVPPQQFNCDISTNAAMILSKANKKPPLEIANELAELIKKNDEEIDTITTVKPGFINIKFKNSFWNKFIKEIISQKEGFGVNKKSPKIKYLIEFVSANPTGPLHVGHCRGAILGDVLSNLLSFNGHKVSKEYYVNDYGNQIIHFSKSVYFRIREILNNEPFPTSNKDLYPGDYIIDIAKKVISSKTIKNFNDFEKIYKKLPNEPLKFSLQLI